MLIASVHIAARSFRTLGPSGFGYPGPKGPEAAGATCFVKTSDGRSEEALKGPQSLPSAKICGPY